MSKEIYVAKFVALFDNGMVRMKQAITWLMDTMKKNCVHIMVFLSRHTVSLVIYMVPAYTGG